MGSRKGSGKKKRLASKRKQIRWAPFWVVPKKVGMKRAKKVHPGRFTKIKRNWRRKKIKG